MKPILSLLIWQTLTQNILGKYSISWSDPEKTEQKQTSKETDVHISI